MELNYDFFIQLAYALGVGMLLGLERSFGAAYGKLIQAGKSAPAAAKDETQTGSGNVDGISGEQIGLRTFTILSVTGFIAALAGERFQFLAPLAMIGICLLIIAMYFRAVERDYGITTEVAAIGAFGLGILCRYHPREAGVLAVVLTVILASKTFTRQTIARMRRVELNDTLKFLVVILIVLPLLPDETLDPFRVFNPYKVGFLVVLISGISFVGYFLMRILGARKGLGLTGILGGLTSSTAVTAAMSSQARQNPALIRICAFSTIAANATMFVRVLVVVALLDLDLCKRLALPVGAMAVIAGILALLLWFRASGVQPDGSGESGGVMLTNPFSLEPALKFALFFVFILFAMRFLQEFFGDSGLYAAAGLSGLADVDAITLSISQQAGAGSLSRAVATVAITIAVVTNSIVKSGIAFYSGGVRFGRLIALCLGVATAIGLAIALLS